VPVGELGEGHLAAGGVLDHRGSYSGRAGLARVKGYPRSADG
jgi:hypothetical protein